MKIVKWLFSIIFISLIITPTAFAMVPIETLINQQSLDMSKEKHEIQEAINCSKMNPKKFLADHKSDLGRNELQKIKSAAELEYGNAYKVVRANKDTIKALLDGTNLAASLQTSTYHWEVPVLFGKDSLNKPVASFTVAKHENIWQIVQIGGYLSPEQIFLSSNSGELISLFKNKSIENANYFAHFRMLPMRIDFLYIATEHQEYFVPLIHARNELYGLKDMELYTRQDLMSTIVPFIKETLNSPNRVYMGSPFSML